jgi:hypothetical protein
MDRLAEGTDNLLRVSCGGDVKGDDQPLVNWESRRNHCRKHHVISLSESQDFAIYKAEPERMIVLPVRSLKTSLEEITMNKLCLLAVFAALFVPGLVAQENYTEGPVWRISLIRVKPTHLDEYLSSLRQVSKPFIDEEKRQGLIVDYKLLLKETKSNPQDWDICIAVEYKNHAALDGLDAKIEAIRDKVLGGKQQAHQIGEKREEIREVISDELLEEIYLK